MSREQVARIVEITAFATTDWKERADKAVDRICAEIIAPLTAERDSAIRGFHEARAALDDAVERTVAAETLLAEAVGEKRARLLLGRLKLGGRRT